MRVDGPGGVGKTLVVHEVKRELEACGAGYLLVTTQTGPRQRAQPLVSSWSTGTLPGSRPCPPLALAAVSAGVAAAPHRGPTLQSLFSMGQNIKSCDKLQNVNTIKEEQWRKKFEADSGMRVEDIAGIVFGAWPQPIVPSPRIRQR
jgi:hypothetical protein